MSIIFKVKIPLRVTNHVSNTESASLAVGIALAIVNESLDSSLRFSFRKRMICRTSTSYPGDNVRKHRLNLSHVNALLKAQMLGVISKSREVL